MHVTIPVLMYVSCSRMENSEKRIFTSDQGVSHNEKTDGGKQLY